MSNDIIQSAIEMRLMAWADAQVPPIPIAYENWSYEPVTGQRYLETKMMPLQTTAPSQGGVHRHYAGLFQISIRTEAGKGTTESRALAGALEQLFQSPLTLQQGGLNIKFTTPPTVAAGYPDRSFWLVPVTLRYQADVMS